MKRENPYPQKRQPGKRISMKKHETIVHILERQIEIAERAVVMKDEKIQDRDSLIVELMLGER